MHDALFQPVSLGAIQCPNRILMAPLTRGRSDPGSVPNALIAEYYRQRAGAGLIISEATGISVEGLGWPAAPGVWSEAQTEGWKLTTEAVHKA
ncbi:MAG: alkene reductase, partial [Novosphingobium sp.]